MGIALAEFAILFLQGIFLRKMQQATRMGSKRQMELRS